MNGTAGVCKAVAVGDGADARMLIQLDGEERQCRVRPENGSVPGCRYWSESTT